jgi:hypothetical protein
MRRNNSWVTSWNNRWKNSLMQFRVLIVSHNQGLIWSISVIDPRINSWMNQSIIRPRNQSISAGINWSMTEEFSKNHNRWIWNSRINWFVNESSQLAIQEVLTQLRLVMIQSAISWVINERIMGGEIRQMKKVNRIRRVGGIRAIGRVRGGRRMRGVGECEESGACGESSGCATVRSIRRVGGMRGVGRMWGGVGCCEFRGREELSRCRRLCGQGEGISTESVSKRHMRSATVIEMRQSSLGETRHRNKEGVLYQKNCELRPN